MFVDAASTGAGASASAYTVNAWVQFPTFLTLLLAESRHFAQVAYQCTTSVTFYGQISVQIGRG
jgi:hypothetical protein